MNTNFYRLPGAYIPRDAVFLSLTPRGDDEKETWVEYSVKTGKRTTEKKSVVIKADAPTVLGLIEAPSPRVSELEEELERRRDEAIAARARSLRLENKASENAARIRAAEEETRDLQKKITAADLLADADRDYWKDWYWSPDEEHGRLLPLYSTVRFGPGTALAQSGSFYRAFMTPLGSSGQGYTSSVSRAETNLKETGRIPTGGAGAYLSQMTVELFGSDSAIEACHRHLVVNFDFVQTLIEGAPLGAMKWDAARTKGWWKITQWKDAPTQTKKPSATPDASFTPEGIWIPNHVSFGVPLMFGKHAPTLPIDGPSLEVRVTLFLQPQAEIDLSEPSPLPLPLVGTEPS